MDNLRSDSILREVLEDRKTLMGFLDAIFGFLSRNTDFYHIQNTKDDKLGFPKGVKEQIVTSCIQKYEQTFERQKKEFVDHEPSFVAEEIEITAEDSNGPCNSQIQQVANNDRSILEASKCSPNSVHFSESDYKNGSVFENYCWAQTLSDVELCVLLPKEVKLAKHVKIDLKSNNITIKSLLPKEEILIDAETWDKYRHNDVIWSLSDGRLILSFEKLKECWWDKLFLTEALINISNLDIERSIADYPPNIQQAIEKIHTQKFGEESNMETLPPKESEEMSRLRKAWNAEGSPFKGQPFDPSIIQFN